MTKYLLALLAVSALAAACGGGLPSTPQVPSAEPPGVPSGDVPAAPSGDVPKAPDAPK